MTDQTNAVVVKLDKILEDDNNFSTRTGLKFMTAVMRDALLAIGEISKDNGKLKELDKALTDYLAAQAAKETKADAERTKWRWAMISPGVAFVVLEIFRWLLR